MSKKEIKTLVPPDETYQPEWLVSTLEQLGGSITRFLAFRDDPNQDDGELVLARIEHLLAGLDDKTFYQRWQAAIKQNRVVRLRLLQESALERLENITQEKAEAPAWRMTEEVAFAKLVLGDLLAGQIHQAKQKQELIAEADDDDDAEAAAAMNY